MGDQLLGRLLLAIALVIACNKSEDAPPKVTPPSEAECAAYRNKLFDFLPAEDKDTVGGLGLDKPTPLEMKLCQERMTSDEIACAVKAATRDEMMTCKPAVDIRPANAKRTPEECARYVEHVTSIITPDPGNGIGPPLTAAMVPMFGRECERWLTKKRYDCVLKATSSLGLASCPP